MQKHISGDRVAGVSLHSVEWPVSIVGRNFDFHVFMLNTELVMVFLYTCCVQIVCRPILNLIF